LNLEIDPSTEPISGRLSNEQGRGHAFTGWLGLAGALHDVLDDLGSGDPMPAADFGDTQ
jgi:hypothetical protein